MCKLTDLIANCSNFGSSPKNHDSGNYKNQSYMMGLFDGQVARVAVGGWWMMAGVLRSSRQNIMTSYKTYLLNNTTRLYDVIRHPQKVSKLFPKNRPEASPKLQLEVRPAKKLLITSPKEYNIQGLTHACKNRGFGDFGDLNKHLAIYML